MEMDSKKETGKEISIVHLNPEVLASIKLNWFYYCIPVINENDPMAYMMFAKQLGDAIAAFGIDSMKVSRLKKEFAKMTGKDFDTWFLNEQELQQHQAEMAQQNGGMQNGGGNAPVVNPKTAFGAQPGAKPSIGKIVRGASPAMAMK